MKTKNETAPSADPKATSNGDSKKKSPVQQSDVPFVGLDEALRIPRAIIEQYASKPTKPLQVAAAISMQPGSGPFRSLCAAAMAYGLTDGGAYAEEISITGIAKKIVKPTQEGEEAAGRREAILKPIVVRQFLEHYDGSQLPSPQIGRNVLEEKFKIPSDRAEAVFETILDLAETAGVLTRIKDKSYVTLERGGATSPQTAVASMETAEHHSLPDDLPNPKSEPIHPSVSNIDGSRAKRVYITHGKNKVFIEPLKKLLAFGELEPVVSVEKSTASTPVPKKVLEDLRSCGAAIIHIESEERLLDQSGNEKSMINPNVLIEIGAAMALFGERFILLVEEGVTLPSNLQGLFEVRYSGTDLGSQNTIALLQAIADMKQRPLPA